MGVNILSIAVSPPEPGTENKEEVFQLTMDSTVARMSSMTFLPLLAILVAANTAVGFIAPSLHAASTLQHSVPSSRCRVTSSNNRAGLRGGMGRRSAGLSMEVEPHVLRLQAAELGSRLRVRREM